MLCGPSHGERAVEGARRGAAELLGAGLVLRRAHLAGGTADGVELGLEAMLADGLGVVGHEHFAVRWLGVDVVPRGGGGGGGGGRRRPSRTRWCRPTIRRRARTSGCARRACGRGGCYRRGR